jgi:hypothetical protein
MEPTRAQMIEQQERLLNSKFRQMLYLDGEPDGRLIRALRTITYRIAAIDGLPGLELLNRLVAVDKGSISGPSKLLDYKHRFPDLIVDFLSLPGRKPSTVVRQAFESLYWNMVKSGESEAIDMLERAFEDGVAAFKATHDYEYGIDRPDNTPTSAS